MHSHIFKQIKPYLASNFSLSENNGIYDVDNVTRATEYARAKLHLLLRKGLRSAEITNAVVKIEEALLYLDHYLQRRASAGIYTLDIPDDNDTLDRLQSITTKTTLIVKFYTDSPEGSTVVAKYQANGVYPYQKIGLLTSLTERYFTDRISFNPWIELHEEDTLILGLLVDPSTLSDESLAVLGEIEETMSKIEASIERIKEDKYPTNLAIYDIIHDNVYIYPEDMMKYGVKGAIDVQKRLIAFVNEEMNQVGFGVGNLCPGLYCFKDEYNQFDVLKEKVKQFLDEEIAKLEVKQPQ